MTSLTAPPKKATMTVAMMMMMMMTCNTLRIASHHVPLAVTNNFWIIFSIHSHTKATPRTVYSMTIYKLRLLCSTRTGELSIYAFINLRCPG